MDYDVKDLTLADKGLGRIESTGGSFLAACRRFVIPAEAGIQRARLDSPGSSTGQSCQARNDGPGQKTIPRSLLRGSSSPPPISMPVQISGCNPHCRPR